FRLRERAALLRREQVDRVIDTRGERAIPTLARRARVQRPLEVGVGSVGIAATDEDLIAAVALRGLEYRRRREQVTVRTDDRERQQADRQTALGRDALELGARGILGRTRARRDEHHERARPLAVPDAAPRRSDRLTDGSAVEHHLPLPARPARLAL